MEIMIVYESRRRARNSETVERLREIAEASFPLDPARRIERAAASIVSDMTALHGGEWRALIDHQSGIVMIVER